MAKKVPFPLSVVSMAFGPSLARRVRSRWAGVTPGPPNSASHSFHTAMWPDRALSLRREAAEALAYEALARRCRERLRRLEWGE